MRGHAQLSLMHINKCKQVETSNLLLIKFLAIHANVRTINTDYKYCWNTNVVNGIKI